jgi:hypothetical protein
MVRSCYFMLNLVMNHHRPSSERELIKYVSTVFSLTTGPFCGVSYLRMAFLALALAFVNNYFY